MRIEWAKEPGTDLRQIHASIAADNKTAPAKAIQTIRETVQALAENPLMGDCHV